MSFGGCHDNDTFENKKDCDTQPMRIDPVLHFSRI